ncbi:MAG: FIST C-terminal domain-containing protein, partial [Planctomycetaceae bacterium]|nr:FIST C-terminal domain-containing protein [Planctomycetaceae bacterium]
VALDDIDAAIAEVHAALRPDDFSPDALGIIACTYDFAEEGVAARIAESLPFPTVGIETTDCAVADASGNILFTVMAVGGDDIRFSLARSESLDSMPETALSDMCRRAMDGLGGREPAFGLVFAPMLEKINDETIGPQLEAARPGLPFFGTLSVRYYDGLYRPAAVFHDNQAWYDRATVALVAGDAAPFLSMATLPKNRILKQKAVITLADDNVVIEVNNRPVIEYLDSLGMVQDGKVPGLHAFPIIIDESDDTLPETRSVLEISPEGYLVCGGRMPEGSVLSIGAQDKDSVLETAGDLFSRYDGDYAAGLFYSCHSRGLALGLDISAEFDLLRERFSGRFPVMMAYSGGEICPRRGADGQYHNMSHSDTLVGCGIGRT